MLDCTMDGQGDIQVLGQELTVRQFGGSPIKVGEDEYSLFRDHELLAKINE
jgi:chaperonin GroES